MALKELALVSEVPHRRSDCFGSHPCLKQLLERLALVGSEVEDLTDTDDEYTDHAGTPDSCAEDKDPAKNSSWIEVSKANSGHGDHDIVGCCEEALEIKSSKSQIEGQLKNAKLVGQEEYRGQQRHGDSGRWVGLDQALVSESEIGSETIALAQLLGVEVREEIVVEDSSDDEGHADEHEHKEHVTHQVVYSQSFLTRLNIQSIN